MKIDISESGMIRLKEVLNLIMFEADTKERLVICMRDGGFEIGIIDNSIKCVGYDYYLKWFSIHNGEIKQLLPEAKQKEKIEQAGAADLPEKTPASP